MDPLDRAIGALLGLAVGDAVFTTLEQRTRTTVVEAGGTLMLSDEWWDRRTHPWGSETSADATTLSWRRARVAHDVIWRWYTELGVVPMPHEPTHGNGGQERLTLMSPLCQLDRRAFASLDRHHDGWHAVAGRIGDLETWDVEPGGLTGPEAWRHTRQLAFAALRLEAARRPGHNQCFHRRGRDLTPVMWTLGLLIRTYGGRSWDAPLTWDGLYQPTVNGHTFSAVGPATNTEDPYGGETPAGADGRAIAVYQPGEWRGVVLTNDGHAWMYATRIEIGHLSGAPVRTSSRSLDRWVSERSCRASPVGIVVRKTLVGATEVMRAR